MRPTTPIDVQRANRMEPKTWLRCHVSQGQFTGEYVVAAKDFQNSTFSLFVPDEYVECDGDMTEDRPVAGWIQVEVLDQNDNLALVQLPRLPLENGRTVTVQRHDIQLRPAREPA
jgi:hypothetical protein